MASLGSPTYKVKCEWRRSPLCVAAGLPEASQALGGDWHSPPSPWNPSLRFFALSPLAGELLRVQPRQGGPG